MDIERFFGVFSPALWRYYSTFFCFYCCYWNHCRRQMSKCLFSLGFIFGFWCSSLIIIFLGVNFFWFILLGMNKWIHVIHQFVISSNIASSPFSLYSLSGIQIINLFTQFLKPLGTYEPRGEFIDQCRFGFKRSSVRLSLNFEQSPKRGSCYRSMYYTSSNMMLDLLFLSSASLNISFLFYTSLFPCVVSQLISSGLSLS